MDMQSSETKLIHEISGPTASTVCVCVCGWHSDSVDCDSLNVDDITLRDKNVETRESVSRVEMLS